MSAALIEIRWQRTGSPVRMGFVLALALAIHLAMMIWWNIKQQPDYSGSEPLKIRLLPNPAVETPVVIPAQKPPIPEFEQAQQPEPAQTKLESTPEPEPLPSAADLMSSLRKFRLSDDRLYLAGPPPPQIRLLGEPPPGDVMLALQHRLPQLPFGSTGLDLAFYSNGTRGDLERFGDAITQEFGFQTRFGTRVKCVVMVVLLVCSWD